MNTTRPMTMPGSGEPTICAATNVGLVGAATIVPVCERLEHYQRSRRTVIPTTALHVRGTGMAGSFRVHAAATRHRTGAHRRRASGEGSTGMHMFKDERFRRWMGVPGEQKSHHSDVASWRIEGSVAHCGYRAVTGSGGRANRRVYSPVLRSGNSPAPYPASH